ncbi:MAG: SRPBCC family protein, partial [Thermomicrobiales bacterium]
RYVLLFGCTSGDGAEIFRRCFMVPEQIERETVIAAPVERVWSVLTEAEHIGQWFAHAGAEVDLRPGGLIVMRWEEHGTYLARIEQVEPYRLFSYRGAYPADEEPRNGNSTLVEFILSPEGDGTRLRVVESGFTSLAVPEEEKRTRIEENTQGWQGGLTELKSYVERLAA